MNRYLFSELFYFGCHRDEADEFVEIGALNGIFVLGRSMGFIGEYRLDGEVLYIVSTLIIGSLCAGFLSTMRH